MKRMGWLLALAGLLVALSASPAQALAGVPPVDGPVVRSFDPPAQRWNSGHRGVDLLAEPGAAVIATAAGTVSFAGLVAGKPVVVVSHGEWRTTYEPVEAAVRVGDRVAAGELLGRLAGGHSCPGGSCLHWGLRRGEEYRDPLSLLSSGVRLLPAEAAALAAERAETRRQGLSSATPASPGLLVRPAAGELGSRFGPRFHPIFHEWRPHQGVDISASCGSQIRAAGPGRVSHVGFDDSGGNRLIIDHGLVGGRRLRTIYLHAEGYQVAVGQRVSAGQVVGAVGSTGWSTGCHLHFSTTLEGVHVDPERLW